MVLDLNANEYLRLSRARGAALEVLEGEVWVTETGRSADALVERGRRFRVGGDGLVLVGTDTRAAGAARIALRAPAGPALGGPMRALLRWLRARETRYELEQLSDWTLRDIGLTRGDLESAVRRLPELRRLS